MLLAFFFYSPSGGATRLFPELEKLSFKFPEISNKLTKFNFISVDPPNAKKFDDAWCIKKSKSSKGALNIIVALPNVLQNEQIKKSIKNKRLILTHNKKYVHEYTAQQLSLAVGEREASLVQFSINKKGTIVGDVSFYTEKINVFRNLTYKSMQNKRKEYKNFFKVGDYLARKYGKLTPIKVEHIITLLMTTVNIIAGNYFKRQSRSSRSDDGLYPIFCIPGVGDKKHTYSHKPLINETKSEYYAQITSPLWRGYDVINHFALFGQKPSPSSDPTKIYYEAFNSINPMPQKLKKKRQTPIPIVESPKKRKLNRRQLRLRAREKELITSEEELMGHYLSLAECDQKPPNHNYWTLVF